MMNNGRTHKVSNFGDLRPVSHCGYIRAMDVHILDTVQWGGGRGELEEDSEEQDSENSEEQDSEDSEEQDKGRGGQTIAQSTAFFNR